MITQFKTLFVLTVAHTYYNGNCEDISFLVPSDTAQLLRNGKLLTREIEGKLYFLFEANPDSTPRTAFAGKTLRIGLRLKNSYFTNFTAVSSDFAARRLLYRNTAAPAALDAAVSVTPIGQVFTHSLGDAARPVTVTLKGHADVTLQTDDVSAESGRSSVSYDLTGQAAGAYTVEESYSAQELETTYYNDTELTSMGAFGFVEIEIDPSFYTAAPEFEISFQARTETLKYYVVGNYSQTEFDQLSVTDAGFTDEGRTQISFTRVPANSFSDSDISPDLLTDGSASVVLFKSQTAVARADKARKKIQLKKNGEVLIENLPQPSADKTTADQIISVSKP